VKNAEIIAAIILLPHTSFTSKKFTENSISHATSHRDSEFVNW
jgi:hypothetical protein